MSDSDGASERDEDFDSSESTGTLSDHPLLTRRIAKKVSKKDKGPVDEMEEQYRIDAKKLNLKGQAA